MFRLYSDPYDNLVANLKISIGLPGYTPEIKALIPTSQIIDHFVYTKSSTVAYLYKSIQPNKFHGMLVTRHGGYFYFRLLRPSITVEHPLESIYMGYKCLESEVNFIQPYPIPDTPTHTMPFRVPFESNIYKGTPITSTAKILPKLKNIVETDRTVDNMVDILLYTSTHALDIVDIEDWKVDLPYQHDVGTITELSYEQDMEAYKAKSDRLAVINFPSYIEVSEFISSYNV